MKYLLPLTLLAAAAVGATRESTTVRAGSLPADHALRAPHVTPPWLTAAWSPEVEMALTDGEGEDPHAGLYAADGQDPHAGLYAAEGAGSEMCPRLDGDLPDQPDGAGVIRADTDPHAAPHGRHALLQAGIEPRVVVPSNAANARTIAQVYAQRTSLAEHVIRVRATVIKRTDGILGKSYLHLWDGSAAPETDEDDLTVTTTAEFEIGETVELEGRLLIDQDLGLGYSYSALLDGATRVTATR
jgi:hypothetical protein